MSHSALKAIDQIIARALHAPSLLFILDYDGTLTPIASRPEEAVLPERTHRVLEALRRHESARVAIVSGRSLADLKQRIPLPLLFAGNHGLEIEGRHVSFVHPGADALVPDLHRALDQIAPAIGAIAGALLEDKGLTASVHFRNAAEDAGPLLRELLQAHLPEGFCLRHGKKVFELRPDVEWHKGAAACWLLDHEPPGTLAICLGDDVTDEDMYAALEGQRHITICVDQHRRTTAHYRLANVDEAIQFLERIEQAMARHEASGPGHTPHLSAPSA